MRWLILSCIILTLICGCAQRQISVVITPAQATLSPGRTVTFAAMVTGTKQTAVDWRLREPEGGFVQGGNYIAPRRAGTFHVIVASQARPQSFTEAAVTVTPMPVILDPVMISTTTGSTKPTRFIATGIDARGEHPVPVIWRVMEKTGGTISSAGDYTPGAATGTFHILATRKGSTVMAKALVIVLQKMQGNE